MYYKIILNTLNEELNIEDLRKNYIKYNKEFRKKYSNCFMYLYSYKKPFLIISLITDHFFDKNENVKDAIFNFKKIMKLENLSESIINILYSEFSRMIDRISDFEKYESGVNPYIVEEKKLDELLIPFETGHFQFKDSIVSNIIPKNFVFESIKSEIFKIKDNRMDKFKGHAFHYKGVVNSINEMHKVCSNLIPVLYENRRLLNTNLVVINLNKHWLNILDYSINLGLHMASGGSALLCFDDIFDQMNKTEFESNINALIEELVIHQHEVLYFFVSNSKNDKVVNYILKQSKLNIQEITTEDLTEKEIHKVIKELFNEYKIEVSFKEFYSTFNELKTKKNIIKHFNEFYAKVLNKNSIETDSSNTSEIQVVENNNCGLEKLNNLIGLSNVKEIINRITITKEAEKFLNTKSTSGFSMHMAFYGNPGTAKTTVARILGEIFREKGILSNGEFFEISRADIVEKYVGWTAKKVKEIFKKAKGSILFIDEAYSLLDGNFVTFGEEAISTIIQEMENNREDTIVIFAGYPEKMKEFVSSNPGLFSRIKYHIEFNDYTKKELITMLISLSHELGYKLNDDCIPLLENYFMNRSYSNNFSNGRDVRNILELAISNQLVRLYRSSETIDADSYGVLSKNDFSMISDNENLNINGSLKQLN